MAERRHVHRREPIEVEVEGIGIFIARPLPWMDRNDLGDEIVRQATESVNQAVRLYTDPELNLPQLEAKLDEKLVDPVAVLKKAFPDADESLFPMLAWEEMKAIIETSLEVNALERLKRLLNPNSPSPVPNGLSPSSPEAGETIGAKIESMLALSLPGSDEEISSDSPTEKSSPSSTSEKNSSGTTEDGP